MRRKHDSQVNPVQGNVAVEDVDIPAYGLRVHLKGFGFIKVLQIVSSNGDTEHRKTEHEKIEYWATSDLTMIELTRSDLARQVFAIENYYRQLKQC